jgi:GNAT superfamily N-acetyltransferase
MNDVNPSLLRLTASDIGDVDTLAREVWQATYPPLISQAQIDAMLADRYSPARIGEQLADPRHAWWGARQGDSLLGFAHAMQETQSICKLDKLYVHPAHQRRGIGAALLKEIEAWAHQRQMGRLKLQVNRGNAQAIRAYEKYGFQVIASYVFDIGQGFVMDDHVMERML